jgi:hypothetical protein
MTNETAKVLLMIILIGGLEAAIHLPDLWKSRRWKSQHWTSLGRALARAWLAIAPTDNLLQLAVLKLKSDRHRPVH